MLSERDERVGGWIMLAVFFGILLIGGFRSQQPVPDNNRQPTQSSADNTANRRDLREPLVITAPSIQVVTTPESQQPRPNERHWYSTFNEHPAEWLMAVFNGLLVGVIGWLVWATIELRDVTDGLWAEAKRSARRQEADTRLLQRATIAVEPRGITPDNERTVIGHVGIVNAGNLPAHSVRWFITMEIGLDGERKDFAYNKATAQILGNNIVPPGASVQTWGSLKSIELDDLDRLTGHRGRLAADGEPNVYLFVYGIVYYNDGFEDGRFTKFCHRYNWKTRHAPLSTIVSAEHARHHEWGNDAS